MFPASRRMFPESRRMFPESRPMFPESRRMFSESRRMFPESLTRAYRYRRARLRWAARDTSGRPTLSSEPAPPPLPATNKTAAVNIQ
jgi:hypothetical protein